MLLDAHCHVEPKDYPDLGEVVERMRAKRVRAVNTGRNLKSNERVLSVARDYSNEFYAAIGLSPHDAGQANLDEEVEFVRCHANEIVAIGECGLDHHYFKDKVEQARQLVAFEAMLELAEELGKPIVVHSRDAEVEVMQVLSSFNATPLLHCLQKPKTARLAPDSAYYSLPTLKNSARVKLIETVPFERLLAETDSPFLWKGGRNEPSNVIEVYGEVARVKGVPVSEVEERFWSNAGELFSWQKS
jgi:TatD DNase family protein